MKDRLFHNIGLKVGSLVIAFILWLVVVSIDDPTITRSFTQVPVELQNTEELTSHNMFYEVVDNTDMITVMATGKRSIIDSLSRDNFRAIADIDKMDQNLVPIEVRATKYSDRLDSVTSRTSNVKLSIEGLLERQISVDVVTEGNVGSNCILGNITMDRSAVKISGPESVVESVDSARVVVDITGISSDISTSEKIVLVDESGKTIDDDRISTNISEVKLNIAVWGSKEVPIVYGYTGVPMQGYGMTGETYIDTSTVKIAADKEILNSINEITIPSSAVDINGAMSDMDIPINLTEYLPSGVALFGQEEVTVTVHIGISALLSKNIQINTANIVLANVPEGMSASIAEPNEFVVTVASGIGNGFINLDEAALTGIADLSVIEIKTEGEEVPNNVYDVPVSIEYPSGVYSGADLTVKVLLTKTEGEGTENTDVAEPVADETVAE